jgi:hypothetical protein
LEEISAALTGYYDSLTDEEIAEDRAWGEFAASRFPTDVRAKDCLVSVEISTRSEATSEVQRLPIGQKD